VSWHPWFAIPGVPKGTTYAVTAINRTSDHIDVFVTGPDGGAYSAYWGFTSGWSSWFRIDDGFTKGASQIAVVARTPDHLDLFVTGSDGGVYSTYWDAASGWADWFRIDSGFSDAHTCVAAVARDSDHLDLFVAGSAGQVHTTYWNAISGWANWSLTDTGFAKADHRFPIAAIARSATHLDLFTTGTDGGVYSSYWDEGSGWAYWFRVDAALGSAKSAVTAISRDADHMDLFVLAASDVVYTTYWDAARGWSTWFRVDNSFTARSGATVTSIARAPDRLDLFVPASDGGVSTTTWNSADGGDRTWFKIDQLSTLTAFDVAVVSRSLDTMDIFITADDEQTDAIQSTYWNTAPGLLRKATIRFDTHNDEKDRSTAVHVFLKTRKNDSSNPNPNPTYLSNSTAFARYASTGTLDGAGPNPYLAQGVYLAVGDQFDDPSSHTYDLDLFPDAISVNDVDLPEVDIHILADGEDRWTFDYTVTLFFDEGSYSFTSKTNGVNGILLDQTNRNYTGIGTENLLRTVTDPVIAKPTMAATLTKVTLEFSTHDADKTSDTKVNVRCVNRLAGGQEQDIVIALDIFPGEAFPSSGGRDDQYRSISWSQADGSLPTNVIRLSDMVLPIFYIVIYPSGPNRWTFDYQVTFEFTDSLNFNSKPYIFSTRYNGVSIDEDSNKHAGVYAGSPFPRIAPPTAPALSSQPIYRNGTAAKHISLDFLSSKLDEFINNRNGGDGSTNPPLRKIVLTSTYAAQAQEPSDAWQTPESYADLGALINGGDGTVRYISNPISLSQIEGDWGYKDAYFESVPGAGIGMFVQPHEYTPISLTVNFAPNGTMVQAFGDIQIDSFSLNLLLTLQKRVYPSDNPGLNQIGLTVADLMAWVDAINAPGLDDATKNALKEEYVKVHFVTDSHFDLGAHIRREIRDTIYDQIQQTDVISNRSRRDDINSLVTSWLTGGTADDDLNTDDNNIVINSIGYEGSDLVMDYLGPTNVFIPAKPKDWPSGHDFSPSTLANIDHIIVLTMENRSFDHMLGYLRLPVENGGMGRGDVDGLKGGEFNPYEGLNFPSYELPGTLFAPGPSNGYESMHQSFNGIMMDGFVKSYAEQNGDALAGNVMGYYTGRNVLAYDAIVRDFALGHRWFCSHPGSTFPNRFYELTGRPNLDSRGFWEFGNSDPIRPVFTPTIFDYLAGASDSVSGTPVTWRYFEYGYCTLRFFEKYTFESENVVSYYDPKNPENGFVASALSGNLPSVTFIDPHFVDYPPGSNCGEPPSNIADGQALIREIVEAVVAGPAWDKTLLVITYDESGGFYDHVPPPTAPRISEDFPISTVGGRIPTMVVSPWVEPGSVFGSDTDNFFFDHTSILKTIVRRFLPNDPPYMGARFAAANDLSSILETAPQDPQFLPFIRYRLEFVSSGLLLDLGPTDRTRIASLHLATPDGSSGQDFSFEDTGDGHVYVRSVLNNLYVTALANSADLVMDVKYAADRQALQKWQLSRATENPTTQNEFVVSNEGKPHLVLRPAQDGQNDALVELVTASKTTNPFVNPNAWKVTSPLLSDSTIVSRWERHEPNRT
jgi:phospholipase C